MKTTEQIMSLADGYCHHSYTKVAPAAREELQAAVKALVQERDAAQADALEQARLNGMGGEREADLLGKVARLERERDALKAELEQIKAQEPVAWMWRCKPYCDWPNWSVSLRRPVDSGHTGYKRTEGYEDIPLYTRSKS